MEHLTFYVFIQLSKCSLEGKNQSTLKLTGAHKIIYSICSYGFVIEVFIIVYNVHLS